MKDASFRPATSLSRALAGGVIRVGSQNRAKLAAVHAAFASFAEAPDALELVGVGVASGVAEQPIGWGEIVRGARNRAEAAFAAGDCAMAVGIEDGLARLADDSSTAGAASGSASGEADRAVFNVGCAWVTDGERSGHGFSSAFAYPPACLEPAWREQAPIGDLFDALWRSHRNPSEAAAPGPLAASADIAASGRSSGNIGMLTAGRLDRSAYGAQAVVCALVRFLHTDLYD